MNHHSYFKKFHLILPVLVFLIISPVVCQQTLNDLVNDALRNNYAIKSAEKSVDAKKDAVNSAYGHLMPEIGIDAYYTHMDKDLTMDLDPIRSAMIQMQTQNTVSLSNLQNILTKGVPLTPQEQQAYASMANSKLESALPHFRENIKEQNFPQAIVSATQPIFTGGKIISGIKAAKSQENAESEKLRMEKQVVINAVITAYINVLLAQDNLKVRLEAETCIRKHCFTAQRMFDEGLIPKYDKLRADVALSEAERNTFEAKEKIKIAQQALISVCGLNSDSLSLGDSLSFRLLKAGCEDYLSLANKNNPQIRLLKELTQAVGQKSNAEMAEYFPTVFAYGFYNVFDHYISAIEPKWGVGIGAQLKLFDGFRRSSNYAGALNELKSMEYAQKEADRKIQLFIRNQYMEMRLAEVKYNKLNAGLELAEENLRLNEKRYETGYGTSLEVIDARVSLDALKLKRLEALKDYYFYLASLYQTTGSAENFLPFWQNQQN